LVADWHSVCNSALARSADCQSAKQQIANLRYGAVRDREAGIVSLRLHSKGNVGAEPKGEVEAEVLAPIKERRA